MPRDTTVIAKQIKQEVLIACLGVDTVFARSDAKATTCVFVSLPEFVRYLFESSIY